MVVLDAAEAARVGLPWLQLATVVLLFRVFAEDKVSPLFLPFELFELCGGQFAVDIVKDAVLGEAALLSDSRL